MKALDPFQLLPASEDIHQRGVLKLVINDILVELVERGGRRVF